MLVLFLFLGAFNTGLNICECFLIERLVVRVLLSKAQALNLCTIGFQQCELQLISSRWFIEVQGTMGCLFALFPVQQPLEIKL